jgi:hypothetical protein
MKLTHRLHASYCTRIHRGESWGQISDNLKRQPLAVRDCGAAGQLRKRSLA